MMSQYGYETPFIPPKMLEPDFKFYMHIEGARQPPPSVNPSKGISHAYAKCNTISRLPKQNPQITAPLWVTHATMDCGQGGGIHIDGFSLTYI